VSFLTPRQIAAARRQTELLREQRESHIEDLVAIGGLKVGTAEAARRIGVCERTIRYYRAELRRREGA
jgi:hypothetical protein